MTENERDVLQPVSPALSCGLAASSSAPPFLLTGAVAGYIDGMREDGEDEHRPSVHGRRYWSLITDCRGRNSGGLSVALRPFLEKRWSKRKQLYTVSLIALRLAWASVSVIALRIGVGDGDPQAILFGDRGSFDPKYRGLFVGAVGTGGMGLSIFIYHRNVDDHEKQAYLWGGLAGFYAIVFPAPAWWLLARAQHDAVG